MKEKIILWSQNSAVKYKTQYIDKLYMDGSSHKSSDPLASLLYFSYN